MATPAQSSFETLLQSDQSSLRILELTNGDAELAIKLIILDSLRSSMKLWEIFLRRLTTSYPLPRASSIGLTEYERDLTCAIEFSSLVRDLCSCTSFLTSSIALEHFTEKSHNSRRWDHLLLELRTSEAVLQNSAQQLLDVARPRFDMAVADSNVSQTISVKRLTIIAAIFLPMGLASSLLSMTESVPKVGELWFDWLGLWLSMGFIVALVYSLWKWMGYLITRPLTGTLISELLESIQTFFFPWLIPFSCIIVVSFWIGMLDRLQTVPEALKWGFVAFAGLVALRLLWFILYHIFEILLYGLQKWRGKRRIHYLLMGCEYFFHLMRLGGTPGDVFVFVTFLFYPSLLPYSVEPSVLSISLPEGLHELVERILKAAARSKCTKRFVQAESIFFRQVIEQADQTQYREAKEVVQRIRSIATTDNQVQELLAGVI
ncbi:hypothetical protein GP486_001994 [Trichoglossum hirsutum]|uniref:Uncharacterized protein n=1 Tax=Trichoglossum hirsutum TaxID=265104 RepID=A0A9P8LFM3_9PEZI|nr:hypothetical protein GP486_001994 [Trichoglossum hirsutum]